MSQNKTTKYFKYAIGEIILVVIGILIALQINNWNEGRKSRAFEIDMLTQIQANLVKDKNTLTQISNNGYHAIQAAKRILGAKEQITKKDSLKFWLGDVVQFDRFQPLTNAYEVLKTSGLDQIQNKELRFLLGTYYDDKAKHIIKAVGDVEYEFTNYWLPNLRKHIVDFKFKQYVVITNPEIFLPPSELRSSLILFQDNYRGTIQYINEGKTIVENIINLINKELN